MLFVVKKPEKKPCNPKRKALFCMTAQKNKVFFMMSQNLIKQRRGKRYRFSGLVRFIGKFKLVKTDFFLKIFSELLAILLKAFNISQRCDNQ